VLYAIRRDVMTRKRWWGALAIGVLAFIVWWILNHGGCANGVMNLIFFILPCWLFFVLDIFVMVIFTILLGRPKTTESAK
jgi:hypothetical protein